MSLYNDLKKPYNLFSTILASLFFIISIILSIIIWQVTKERKKITFTTAEITKIIDKEILPNKIKLIDSNNNEIAGNVYLITGSVINKGNVTIEKSDIRIPLFIELDSNTNIIDYSITEQFDSAIAGFSLVKRDTNRLYVSWKYFDPTYGFKFKIICKADSKPTVKLLGKILKITDFNSNKTIKGNGRQLWLYLLFFTLTCYYIIYVLELFPRFRKEFESDKNIISYLAQIYIYFIAPIAIAILCLYMYYHLS